MAVLLLIAAVVVGFPLLLALWALWLLIFGEWAFIALFLACLAPFGMGPIDVIALALMIVARFMVRASERR